MSLRWVRFQILDSELTKDLKRSRKGSTKIKVENKTYCIIVRYFFSQMSTFDIINKKKKSLALYLSNIQQTLDSQFKPFGKPSWIYSSHFIYAGLIFTVPSTHHLSNRNFSIYAYPLSRTQFISWRKRKWKKKSFEMQSVSASQTCKQDLYFQ